MDNSIKDLVDSFLASLTSTLEEAATERAKSAIAAAFGDAPKRRERPPTVIPTVSAVKTRKKPPRQLCPVPGCKNTAAPIFGMVCKDHKDVPKAKILKYRAERKAKKAA